MWQDISREELLNLALAALLLVMGIAVCAVLLIATLKLVGFLLRRLFSSRSGKE